MERKNRLIIILGIAVVAAFALLIAAGGLKKADAGRLGQLEERIRRMDQLVTARQTYREVIYTEKKQFLADRRVLFSVLFSVEAGVRLDNCRVRRERNGTVIIYLAPVQILSIDSDESTIKQYFIKEQFSQIRFSDYAGIIEEEKKQLEREAALTGLENRARINTVTFLENLFGAAGIGEIEVRFVDSLGGRL